MMRRPFPRWFRVGQHLVAEPSRDGRTIARMDDLEHSAEERGRNARLAEAAPLLRDTVEALLEYAERFADLNGEPEGGHVRGIAGDASALLDHIEKGEPLP